MIIGHIVLEMSGCKWNIVSLLIHIIPTFDSTKRLRDFSAGQFVNMHKCLKYVISFDPVIPLI